jgi:hypothetical protein
VQREVATVAAVPAAAASRYAGRALATLRVRVLLADGAALPKYDPSPTVGVDRSCTPSKDSDALPLHVGAGMEVGGLVVAVAGTSGPDGSNGVGWPTRASQRFDVAVEDCRLEPRLVVAKVGDTLHLENHTDIPVFPGLGEAVTRALLPNAPYEVRLAQLGVFRLDCAMMGACGRSEVVVLPPGVAAAATNVEGIAEFRLPIDEALHVSPVHSLIVLSESIEPALSAGEMRTVTLHVAPHTTAPAANAIP